MGSPISVVVANLVMEELETRALNTFADPPRIYRRYVDDTICVMKKHLIQEFHDHINKQDPNIKFTVERYNDEGIPFLDTLNRVKQDGTLDILIYRKRTHTDRYLQFTSHHPPQHKAAVVRTLVHRADSLLSDEKHRSKEHEHIRAALNVNGYPKQFVRKYSRDKPQRPQAEEKSLGFATLPYVQGATERIQRVLGQHKIKSAVRPLRTVKQLLSRPKDSIKKEKQTGVVYAIPCSDCNAVYVGETGRSLATRTREHQASVRLGQTEKSALAEHATKTGHPIKWSEVAILGKEGRYHQRKWEESWHIAKNKDTLSNRDSGRILPQHYHPLIQNL